MQHITPVSKTLVLKIPVSEAVKKFVYWHENIAPHTERAVIHHNSLIADLLLPYLVRVDMFNRMTVKPHIDELDAEIRIEIPTRKVEIGEYFLSDTGILAFNTIMRKMMVEHLTKRILDRATLGFVQTDAINDFLEDLEADESLQFAQLKKASFRLRIEKNYPPTLKATRKFRYTK